MNVDLKIQTNDLPSLDFDMMTEDMSTLTLGVQSEQPLKLTTDGTNYFLSAEDYRRLMYKPSIEGVELYDNKTFDELGLQGSDNVVVSHGKIDVPEITAAQLASMLTDD